MSEFFSVQKSLIFRILCSFNFGSNKVTSNLFEISEIILFDGWMNLKETFMRSHGYVRKAKITF